MPNNMTINVHHPDPIQFQIHDDETAWIKSGDLTIFFDTPADAITWLSNGIVAVNTAQFRYNNPPEPAPDAHLEPDYDDRNGD